MPSSPKSGRTSSDSCCDACCYPFKCVARCMCSRVVFALMMVAAFALAAVSTSSCLPQLTDVASTTRPLTTSSVRDQWGAPTPHQAASASSSKQLTDSLPAAGRVPVTDVAFAIMTGKEHFDTRVRWIQDTWLRWLPDHPATFFVSEFVEGATPNGTRFIETNHTCCGYYPSQRKWRESLIEMMKPGFLPESVKWLWIADDDSFVVVPNALRFLADKDPNERRVYGEMCAVLRGWPALCGGATWVAPIFVMKELAAWLETVDWPMFENEVLSDRIFSKAMRDLLNVTLVDTKEFVSQPPMFVFDNPHKVPYKTAGWGHVVSFHYMKEPDMRMVMQLYEAFQPT